MLYEVITKGGESAGFGRRKTAGRAEPVCGVKWLNAGRAKLHDDLPLAADNNPCNDTRHAQDLRPGERLLEKEGTGEHHQNEGETDKGIGMTQRQLGHCRHPGQRGEECRQQSTEYPGVEERQTKKT